MQRLKNGLEIAFVALLSVANATTGAAAVMALGGEQHVLVRGALYGFVAFNFVAACLLLGRFLALIDQGDPYYD
jgi:hypothetical protein